MYRQFLVFSIVSLILITSCKETRYDLDIPTSTVETNDTILLQNIEHNHSNVGRAIWQKPGLVIEKLGDISDKVIADIGAGTGYFSFRLAPRAKKVIAIEIDEALIKYIDSSKINLPSEKQDLLETRLAKSDNPMLKDNEADIILIINTIAYIDDLPSYLKILKKGLNTNGKIIIVDYKMKKLPINSPPKSERIYLDKLEELLEASGYDIIETDDTSLDFQYIITATKN
jgi:SAM-dependent methyltransferase